MILLSDQIGCVRSLIRIVSDLMSSVSCHFNIREHFSYFRVLFAADVGLFLIRITPFIIVGILRYRYIYIYIYLILSEHNFCETLVSTRLIRFEHSAVHSLYVCSVFLCSSGMVYLIY